MAPFKRKYDEIDDSDSDEPSFGRQILPVADLPHDFDGEPRDGMQYLFTVRRDAKALPHITRVANPYENDMKPVLPQSSRRTPHPALPSAEWRHLNETRWRNFRVNFNQPTIGVDISSAQSLQKKLMPDKKERELWWHFLSGQPESVWNRPPKKSKKQRIKEAKLKQQQQNEHGEGMRAWESDHRSQAEHQIEEDVDEDVIFAEPEANIDEGEVESVLKINPSELLPTPSGTPAPSEEQECHPEVSHTSITTSQETPFLIPREPSPLLLKLIDERMALHLLMYFTYWINLHLREPGSSVHLPTETHARWIFALLLRVDDYISADDLNLLRNLARACLAFAKISILERTKGLPPKPSNQDDDMEKKAMNEQACWIIISAIVGIWGQRDLWMDAEEALGSIEP